MFKFLAEQISLGTLSYPALRFLFICHDFGNVVHCVHNQSAAAKSNE